MKKERDVSSGLQSPFQPSTALRSASNVCGARAVCKQRTPVNTETTSVGTPGLLQTLANARLKLAVVRY